LLKSATTSKALWHGQSCPGQTAPTAAAQRQYQCATIAGHGVTRASQNRRALHSPSANGRPGLTAITPQIQCSGFLKAKADTWSRRPADAHGGVQDRITSPCAASKPCAQRLALVAYWPRSTPRAELRQPTPTASGGFCIEKFCPSAAVCPASTIFGRLSQHGQPATVMNHTDAVPVAAITRQYPPP